MTAGARPVRSGKVAMRIFVISDALAFAGLLFAYAYLRSRGHGSWAGGPAPELGRALPMTAALLASSGTLALAVRAREGRRTLLLAATAGLGALFCAGQAAEWTALTHAGLLLGASPRASSFYLLTGYHGLHVAVGAAALAVLALRRAGRDALEVAAVYWHFVDVVWLFLLAGLYVV